jgi:hypothetical protein
MVIPTVVARYVPVPLGEMTGVHAFQIRKAAFCTPSFEGPSPLRKTCGDCVKAILIKDDAVVNLE